MAVVFPAHGEDWVMEVIASKPRMARLGGLLQKSEALLFELPEAGRGEWTGCGDGISGWRGE